MRTCWIHTLLFVNACEMCRADALLWTVMYGNAYIAQTAEGRLRLLDPATVTLQPMGVLR